jgi:hypothetical protein
VKTYRGPGQKGRAAVAISPYRESASAETLPNQPAIVLAFGRVRYRASAAHAFLRIAGKLASRPSAQMFFGRAW